MESSPLSLALPTLNGDSAYYFGQAGAGALIRDCKNLGRSLHISGWCMSWQITGNLDRAQPSQLTPVGWNAALQ
jgi:hypothetical protein